MGEPAPAAGWYPDPWKQAELRWHDGADWSGHVHGAAAPEPPPALPARPALPPAVPAWNGTAKASPKAIAALITALAGVPVISIVLGVLARRDIAASGGRLTGNGLAIAGIVLGALNLVALAFFIWLGTALLTGEPQVPTPTAPLEPVPVTTGP